MGSDKLALFFLYPSFGGGSTSFTVHLYRAFQEIGLHPFIYRIRQRGEENTRPFAKYEGVVYRNITIDEALKIVRKRPSLMTAACHSKHLPYAPDAIQRLMKRGMRVVIHDPNEFKVYDYLEGAKFKQPPFCIRATMRNIYEKAVFIPHPYVRDFDAGHWTPHKDREHLAVSIARVTFVKRTHLILEANRLLENKNKIILRGAENRLYTRHVLSKKFPEYVQGQTGFPLTWGASAMEAEKAVFAVDLTYFPDDGGGSQYSFMEAWDAGAVNIVHKDWLRYVGEMNAHPTDRAKGNCIAIKNPEQLADWLKLYRQSNRWRDDCKQIVLNGFKQLMSDHNPSDVADCYWEILKR